MEIPAVGGQLAEQRAAVDDPLGVQMHDIPLAGDLPIDAQQAGAQQDAPLGLEELRPHHHVYPAGLVFEGDEHGTPGGAGALPAGDDASGAGQLAVRGGGDVGGA